MLRAADGRRCKVLDPGNRRRTNEEWDDRQHKALAERATKETF